MLMSTQNSVLSLKCPINKKYKKIKEKFSNRFIAALTFNNFHMIVMHFPTSCPFKPIHRKGPHFTFAFSCHFCTLLSPSCIKIEINFTYQGTQALQLQTHFQISNFQQEKSPILYLPPHPCPQNSCQENEEASFVLAADPHLGDEHCSFIFFPC